MLQTAAEAFAERGFAATTLNELIRRSGLAKGAFYLYFPSKEALALAVLRDKQREWLAAIGEDVLAQPTAAAQLRALGPAIARLHHDDPGSASIARLTRDLSQIPDLAEPVREPVRDWIRFVAGIVARVRDDGQLSVAADPELVATVLVAATDGLKDLSDLLDGPGAQRGYERRLTGFAELMATLLLKPAQ